MFLNFIYIGVVVFIVVGNNNGCFLFLIYCDLNCFVFDDMGCLICLCLKSKEKNFVFKNIIIINLFFLNIWV